MKLSLKSKLIISYVLLSMFLVFSIVFMSNFMLEKQFQKYIQKNQEQKNLEFVQIILEEFNKGANPSIEFLHNLGENALNQGVILMVNDKFDKELFCMSCTESLKCENMLDSMQQTMNKRYPNWNGKYTEKTYGLTKDGNNYGKVTLGYYGPFYYSDADMHFIDVLNQIFLTVAIIFLIIAIGLGYFMTERMAKPIKGVINKTKQIEQGDFSNRISIVSNINEIDQLIGSVNTLANTLEVQQKTKKRMASDYAHEFRTPLASLQSNFEGMIDGIFEATPERLDSCREEILRLARMVSDIDKIVELENSNMILKKERFNLGNLVEQIALNFDHNMAMKSIKLELQKQPCEVTADKDKISQVAVNLISNAIKYTDIGGKITIAVKNHGNTVSLSVADTGIGMSAEDLPNIFEHLYRTDRSRNRDTGGTGIGLSVVKAIVEAHGGTIEVKSELSVGSEFVITFKK